MEIFQQDQGVDIVDLELQFITKLPLPLQKIANIICSLISEESLSQEKAFINNEQTQSLSSYTLDNAARYKKAINELLGKYYLPPYEEQINILYIIIQALDALKGSIQQDSICCFSGPSDEQFLLFVEHIVKRISLSSGIVGFVKIGLDYFIIHAFQKSYKIKNIKENQCVNIQFLYEKIKSFYQYQSRDQLEDLAQAQFWRQAKFLQIGLASTKQGWVSFEVGLPQKIRNKMAKIGDIILNNQQFSWNGYIYYDEQSTLCKEIVNIFKTQNTNRMLKLFTQMNIFQKLKEDYYNFARDSSKYQKMVQQVNQISKNVDVILNQFNQNKHPIAHQVQQSVNDVINCQGKSLLAWHQYNNLLIFQKQGAVWWNKKGKRQVYPYPQQCLELIKMFSNSSILSQVNQTSILLQKDLKQVIVQQRSPNIFRKISQVKELLQLDSSSSLMKKSQSGMTLYKLFKEAVLNESVLQQDPSHQCLHIALKMILTNNRRKIFYLLANKLKQGKKINCQYLLELLIPITHTFLRPNDIITFIEDKLIMVKYRIKLSAIQSTFQYVYQDDDLWDYTKHLPFLISNNRLTIGVISYSQGSVQYITHNSKNHKTKNINDLLTLFKNGQSNQQEVDLIQVNISANQRQNKKLIQFSRKIQQIKLKNEQKEEFLNQKNQINIYFQDTVEYYRKAQDKEIYCKMNDYTYIKGDYCVPKTHYGSLTVQQRKKIVTFRFQGKSSTCTYIYYYWDGCSSVQTKKTLNLYAQFQEIVPFLREQELRQNMTTVQQRRNFIWQMILQRVWVLEICMGLLQNYQEKKALKGIQLKRGYHPSSLGRYLHGDQYASVVVDFKNQQEQAQKFLEDIFASQKLGQLLKRNLVIVYYMKKGKEISHFIYLLDHKTCQLPEESEVGDLLLAQQQLVFTVVMLGDEAFAKKDTIHKIRQGSHLEWENRQSPIWNSEYYQIIVK